MNLFHSARLKFTAFYFGILVVLCLVLTFGVRAVTGYELRQGDAARSGAVHRIFERFYDGPNMQAGMQPPPNGSSFTNAEHRQSDVTRDHLNRDFVLIDVGVLAVGAILSYWYAGRTLKPIEQAHEDQKRFTADASHELRTPLASMRLENEVFLRQKAFSEHDARDLISSNLEEVARLERLASNLLALNSYEHATLQKTTVDMAEFIADAITRAQQLNGQHAVFNTTAETAQRTADRESLTELLGILLDNAIKYGPKKGPIVINGYADGDHYVITVRDHGPGIDSTDLPHIFERMYRADKARSSKIAGHGIGLSLARQIASANGAQLTAANHPEGGAVFTLVCT